MDKQTIHSIGSAAGFLVLLGGTVALIIIDTVMGRPVQVPDVLVNLDILAGTAYFVSGGVQNGARAAGMAAAQVAVAAAQRLLQVPSGPQTPTAPGA